MRTVTTTGRWVMAGMAAAAVALVPSTAMAGTERPGGDQGTQTGGGLSDGKLTSTVQTTGDKKPPGATSKSFTAANNWTPPACWYEPRTAAEFQTYVEGFYTSTVNYPGQHSYAKTAAGQFREIYKDGKYKNYNLDKASEGAFWVAVVNPDRATELGAMSCSDLPEWVPNGTPPPFRQAITPEMLAQVAYGAIDLPTTKVSLAPADNTKVNLGTWAWLDKSVFEPKSVTATLNAGGTTISATATATPQSVRLKPGTQDATLHPASGECAFDPAGGAGAPFTPGSENQTPPCGITYLRSSGTGTYPLQATVTWTAAWTGSNGQSGPLESGAMAGEPQNVTVQEIQAVNR
ncbi:hypothetical protein ACFWCB_27360 [Streptomyces sp. NPDC060048]|uniref:hypothetical protein n=1 Tax=unclassified Streptomyces TaxID=2593676 RepID=UPI0036CF3173